MARLGRVIKALKEGRTAADPEDNNVLTPSTSDRSAPRISLPYVGSHLNMHQFNGIFEAASLEARNGHSAAVDSPAGWFSHSLVFATIYLIPNAYHSVCLFFAETALPQSPNPSNGESITNEWSAVGHAATGKSGRVIHSLQEEIARLTRECSLYRSRAEETQRMNDVFKTQVQNMTEQLRNLEMANEANLHSISRKDRKIESLRAEIQIEKNRRETAEGESRKVHHLMVESRDEFNRKTAELNEIANLARTQYDALAQAGQRERAEMQRRFQAIRGDIASLREANEKKNVQLERLDAIMAQKNREIEASRESFDKLVEDYAAYKRAYDSEVREMIERAYKNEAKLDVAVMSLKETEGRMRWAINRTVAKDLNENRQHNTPALEQSGPNIHERQDGAD